MDRHVTEAQRIPPSWPRPGDPDIRMSEGWKFRTKNNRDTIVTINSNKFASDDEALAYVVKRADEGSPYHQECFNHVLKQRLTK